MTSPVRTLLVAGEGPFCEDFFTVSFYMPREYQVGLLGRVPDTFMQCCREGGAAAVLGGQDE
jgi:hypothetical protein